MLAARRTKDGQTQQISGAVKYEHLYRVYEARARLPEHIGGHCEIAVLTARASPCQLASPSLGKRDSHFALNRSTNTGTNGAHTVSHSTGGTDTCERATRRRAQSSAPTHSNHPSTDALPLAPRAAAAIAAAEASPAPPPQRRDSGAARQWRRRSICTSSWPPSSERTSRGAAVVRSESTGAEGRG